MPVSTSKVINTLKKLNEVTLLVTCSNISMWSTVNANSSQKCALSFSQLSNLQINICLIWFPTLFSAAYAKGFKQSSWVWSNYENDVCIIWAVTWENQIFAYAKKKDADELRGSREADQRLCFHYTDSTIPLLLNPKFQASSHLQWLPSRFVSDLGSESPKTGFLMSRLIYLYPCHRQ